MLPAEFVQSGQAESFARPLWESNPYLCFATWMLYQLNYERKWYIGTQSSSLDISMSYVIHLFGDKNTCSIARGQKKETKIYPIITWRRFGLARFYQKIL